MTLLGACVSVSRWMRAHCQEESGISAAQLDRVFRILGREVSCVFAVGFISQEVIQSPAFTRDAQAVEQAGQSTMQDEPLSVQSSQRTRRRNPSVYRQVLGIQLAVRGWDYQVLVNCAEVSRYIKPCGRSTDEKKVIVAVAQIPGPAPGSSCSHIIQSKHHPNPKTKKGQSIPFPNSIPNSNSNHVIQRCQIPQGTKVQDKKKQTHQ